MIFYLTFNDLPSGIFSSQIIDVVKFIRQNFSAQVKLVSFISLRAFWTNRKKIKNEMPDAIVLPMFPKLSNWSYNRFLLQVYCYFYKPKKIICRSVLATHLGFLVRNKRIKIVYDGRGAISAEWNEYKVVDDKQLLKTIINLESEAILNSDFRIAVSKRLLEYWRETFNYNNDGQVVIPCTLNKVFEKISISAEKIEMAKKKIGCKSSDIVFIYSGSMAGWQGFELLKEFIQPILSKSINYKLVFLSGIDKNVHDLINLFPNQVFNFAVQPAEVPSVLIAADYGLLIRENSITNKVASPVKFAEYIACGLKVILSEQLGDYSEYVVKNNCGYINGELKNINTINIEEKIRISQMKRDFVKENYVQEYTQLI